MKKAIAITSVLVLVVVAAGVAFKYFSINAASAGSGAQDSNRAASLQSKIDTVKSANTANREHQSLEVSEEELESYAMVSLRDKIPVRMESIRVQLTPGSIAAEPRLTIPAGSTGNVLVDALLGGTHNLYVKGKLSGANGRGKFVLQSVQVDGIPVPAILIDTLIRKYAKPRYPDTDLKKPFNLPWGIDGLDIGQGKATITY